jgi:hypothetical protein
MTACSVIYRKQYVKLTVLPYCIAPYTKQRQLCILFLWYLIDYKDPTRSGGNGVSMCFYFCYINVVIVSRKLTVYDFTQFAKVLVQISNKMELQKKFVITSRFKRQCGRRASNVEEHSDTWTSWEQNRFNPLTVDVCLLRKEMFRCYNLKISLSFNKLKTGWPVSYTRRVTQNVAIW